MRPLVLVLALVVLLLASLVGLLLWSSPVSVETRADGPGAAAAAPAPDEGPADLAAPGEAGASGERTAAPAQAPAETPVEPAPAAAEAPAPTLSTVRVVDVVGAPVPGLRVVRAGTEATTDADGRAALPRSGRGVLAGLLGRGPESGDVELADGTDHLVVARGTHRGGEADGVETLVVAREIEVAGEVLDSDGLPIEGARVAVEGDEPLLRYPHTLDPLTTVEPSSRAESGADGRFVVEGAAFLPWAAVSARKAGFSREEVALDGADPARVVLTLERAGETESGPSRVAVEGVVLLPGGAPAAGATLRFVGNDRSQGENPRTDEEGRFRIEVSKPWAERGVLAATLEGRGTAVHETFHEEVLAAWPESPEPLTIVLPGRDLTIRGRVVDPEGEGLRGWSVQLFAGSPLADGFVGTDQMVEPSDSVTSDEDGTFELGGLVDADYVVVAYRTSSGLAFRHGPVAAGTEGVELVVDPGAVAERVEGRVETYGGRPLAGARVGATTTVMEMSSGGGTVRQGIGGPSARTDADGRFVLRDLPLDLAYLSVDAPEGTRVAPENFEVEDLDLEREVVLRVPEMRPLRPEVAGAADGDARVRLEARDALGERVTWTRFDGGGTTSTKSLSWGYRNAAVWWVSEAAVEVVVFAPNASGAVVERDRAPAVWSRDGSPTVVRLSVE